MTDEKKEDQFDLFLKALSSGDLKIQAEASAHPHDILPVKVNTVGEIITRVATGFILFAVTGISLFLIGIGTDIKLMAKDITVNNDARLKFESEIDQRVSNNEQKLSQPRFTEQQYIKLEDTQNKYMLETRQKTQNNKESIEDVKDDIRNISEDMRVIRRTISPEHAPTQRHN